MKGLGSAREARTEPTCLQILKQNSECVSSLILVLSTDCIIILAWVSFAGTDKAPLAFLEGKQDVAQYIKTLEDTLLPISEELLLSWGFIQDCAPCRRARVPKRWMFGNFISVLEWPPYLPDINPIENLWGILVRSVYSHQKQFNDVDYLSACIRDDWDEINKDTVDALVKYMQKRCVEVVLAKGKKIDY